MTERINDPFRALAHSSLDLLRRFGVAYTSPPSVDGPIAVFQEEVTELIEAAREETDKRHIGEEAADVIVTVINLCHAVGVDLEIVVEQMAAVAAKNDAKTHQTHFYQDGKIRRRPSQK
jgi:NTP pyrophosphatase (non-canonical NTP hydrolase)